MDLALIALQKELEENERTTFQLKYEKSKKSVRHRDPDPIGYGAADKQTLEQAKREI